MPVQPANTWVARYKCEITLLRMNRDGEERAVTANEHDVRRMQAARDACCGVDRRGHANTL